MAALVPDQWRVRQALCGMQGEALSRHGKTAPSYRAMRDTAHVHEWGTKAPSRDSAFVLCERLFFAVIVYAAAGLALFQETDNCVFGCLLLYIGV